MGYHQAGFSMVGVDINPQKNYPFEFIQANALGILQDADFLSQFDFIHASPPARIIPGLQGFRGRRARFTRIF
jgi:DNA (cytosine-5)-methyltransferase 1